MNKQRYMEILYYGLAALPDNERDDLLRSCEARFAQEMHLGKTEEQIAGELGDPQLIVRQLLGARRVTPQPWVNRPRDIPRIIGVSLMLFFLNLLIVLPLAVTLWAVFAALAVTALAALLAPAALLAEYWLYGEFVITKLYMALAMTGIGMLLAAVVRYLGRGLWVISSEYGKWNYRTWRGRSST